MSTQFQDLQHVDSPRNGQRFGDQQSVVALFEELRRIRPPFMCQFIADNGDNLTIGIDSDWGCVQHCANDGMPPYLMAVDSAVAYSDQLEMRFLVGDTPTPINGRYRITCDMVLEIVAAFVTSGERSASVSWIEFQPGT